MFLTKEYIAGVVDTIAKAAVVFDKGELLYKEGDCTVYKIITTVGSGATVYIGTRRLCVITENALNVKNREGYEWTVNRAFNKIATKQVNAILDKLVAKASLDEAEIQFDVIEINVSQSIIPEFTQIQVKSSGELVGLYVSSNEEDYKGNLEDASELSARILTTRIVEGKLPLEL